MPDRPEPRRDQPGWPGRRRGGGGAGAEPRHPARLRRPGLPADAYDVTGSLSLLASRLPQALAQLLTFLQAEVQAGRVVIVSGPDAGDPAAMLAAVTGSLDAAVASARRLHRALDAAQNQLTWAAASSE